jgi:predicted RNA binding protein YcfA (HicA-like mRNA interferase family)
MKVSEILRLLHEHGCKHASKSGRITVAGKSSDDLAPGTLNSILKRSGLKK